MLDSFARMQENILICIATTTSASSGSKIGAFPAFSKANVESSSSNKMQNLQETYNKLSLQIDTIRETDLDVKEAINHCKITENLLSEKIVGLLRSLDEYKLKLAKCNEQLEVNNKDKALKEATLETVNIALIEQKCANGKLQQELQNTMRSLDLQLALRQSKNIPLTVKILPLEGLLNYVQQNNEQLRQEVRNLKTTVADQQQQILERKNSHSAQSSEKTEVAEKTSPIPNKNIWGDKEEAN